MNKTRQVQITIQKMYLGYVRAGCLHLIWKQWQHGKAYPQHPVAPGFRHSATRVLPSSGVPAWENIHNHINTSWKSTTPCSLTPHLPSLPPIPSFIFAASPGSPVYWCWSQFPTHSIHICPLLDDVAGHRNTVVDGSPVEDSDSFIICVCYIYSISLH